jgi:phospholipase D1/2
MWLLPTLVVVIITIGEHMDRILRAGRNCWTIRPAPRFRLCIDGRSYFATVHDALSRIQRQALLLGWDFDSRVALKRDEQGALPGSRLREVLDAAAGGAPDARIYVLAWDYAMLFSLEREPLPVYQFAWRSHPRVSFHMDGEHPLGASHHQKIAVLDDSLGFVGGLDLTKRRWDTPSHHPDDPRRVDPGGHAYGPFHDLQAMFDGPAAKALAELARERWFRATGKRLPAVPEGGADLWPDNAPPDMRDVEVALARTEPAFKGRPEVMEIRRLHLDAIEAARECIYIENQYLTAPAVVDALARRLSEEQGPEVLLLLPERSSGWLEESVMDSLRDQALVELARADSHGRLAVHWVAADKNGKTPVKIHAKALIVDDRLICVGSANLNNRSMGLDTECAVVVEAQDNDTVRGIRALRERLLAEHLGVPAEGLAESLADHGSVLAAVRAMNHETGKLRPLAAAQGRGAVSLPEDIVVPLRSLDPERPMALDRIMDSLAEEQGGANGHGIMVPVLIVLLLAGLALVWRFSPWGGEDMASQLAAAADFLRGTSWAPALVLGAFLVGGLVSFPVTLLIALTAVVFAPPWGIGYSLAGCLSSAALTYGLGLKLGRGYVRRAAGSRLNRISRGLGKRGMLSVLMVRILPVAPFSVINLVAGASHIRFRDFLLGTLLGMAPGIVMIALFTESFKGALQRPSLGNIALLLLAAAVLLGGGYLLKRRLTPLRDKDAAG